MTKQKKLTQLKDITKQMYEQNLELVNANKETSLLQELYEITLKTYDVEELSSEFLNLVLKELNFNIGIIALQSGKSNLKIVASNTYKTNSKIKELSTKIQDKVVAIDDISKNLLVKSIKDQKLNRTNRLEHIVNLCKDCIFKPDEVQANCLVFPITIRQKTIGVFSICSTDGRKKFTHFEDHILKRLANAFNVSLDRTRIYEDLQSATNNLKKANKKLHEVDELKDEFVSVASHELRTPMTAIKNYLWLTLSEGGKKLDKNIKEYLDIAYGSTNRLIELVNDMLTISRIESGRITFKPEDFDFNILVQSVYDELKPISKNSDINFKLTITPKKTIINGDKNKLAEVIHNVVGNALKFTPKDGNVKITLAHKEKNAVLEISDTGPGIAEENITKIFSKFAKLEHSYKKTKATGTGLGLYISKKIIEHHGGKIEIQSALNKGSSFIITLPMSKA